ncbi:MAG: WD40 repeat domain-containing protein, partial [Cyanobacteria bacterium J06623_5]
LQDRYETIEAVALDLQSSQHPYQTLPRQLLNQAKASMPGLTKRLKQEGSAVMERLRRFETRPSLPPTARLANNLNTKNLANSLATSKSTQDWQRRHRLAPDIGLTQSLAVSPDGQQFASGGVEGAIHLWHLPSGELRHTFPRRRLLGSGHADSITALRFHPDSRALYSASTDGTLKEWDSAERSLLNTLPTAGWTTTDLKIDARGRLLVSANSDGRIVIWDIETLLPVAQLVQHQSRVSAIALSPKGDLLASISTDGSAKLWNWEQQPPRLSKTLSLAQLHKDLEKETNGSEGVAIAITPSNQSPPNKAPLSKSLSQLIIATSRSVIAYPLGSHPQQAQPVGIYHSPHAITAMALSANGTVAIGTEDRLLTLWDLYTGDCVAQLAHDWGFKAIAFSKDSNTLITATADEVISIWENKGHRNQA